MVTFFEEGKKESQTRREGDFELYEPLNDDDKKALAFSKQAKARLNPAVTAPNGSSYFCCQYRGPDGAYQCEFTCYKEKDMANHFAHHCKALQHTFEKFCPLCYEFYGRAQDISMHFGTGHGLTKFEVKRMHSKCKYLYKPL